MDFACAMADSRPMSAAFGPTLPTVDGDDPDGVLMHEFARGDARAFEQLYARHHAGLYRFVRRLLGPSLGAQVDEVFQDTWLRVVQSRTRWQPQGASFRTWLYTLAHHRAVDQLRKSGRELPLIDGEDGEPYVPEQAQPWGQWPSPAHDDSLFWRRAGQRLLECLEQLPAAQKTVFLLHHEEGCALEELARALDLGFETAKSRLRYAMSKLRVCMGAYLDGMVAR